VLETAEVVEFARMASVLLVNVGTITSATFESMLMATRAYQKAGKPWVLDPVAAGATKYRIQVRSSAASLGADSLLHALAGTITPAAAKAGDSSPYTAELQAENGQLSMQTLSCSAYHIPVHVAK
jgi:hydroxyethylthiazole kinase